MRHPRIIVGGIGLAVVAAVGGVTAASAGGSPASRLTRRRSQCNGGDRAHRASNRRRQDRDHPGQRPRPAPVLLPGRHRGEVVRHRGAGQALAPADLSRTHRRRCTGKVTVVNDANGRQVAYNGHLLYTFISDHPGELTGQGVQNFFVATPGLAPIAATAAPAGPAPAAPARRLRLLRPPSRSAVRRDAARPSQGARTARNSPGWHGARRAGKARRASPGAPASERQA